MRFIRTVQKLHLHVNAETQNTLVSIDSDFWKWFLERTSPRFTLHKIDSLDLQAAVRWNQIGIETTMLGPGFVWRKQWEENIYGMLILNIFTMRKQPWPRRLQLILSLLYSLTLARKTFLSVSWRNICIQLLPPRKQHNPMMTENCYNNPH